MIIIGSDYIGHDYFEGVHEIKDIVHTSSNTTLLFFYNLDLMEYCFKNTLPYAVILNSIQEAVFANNLGAKYLITDEHKSKTIQTVAENYMFDSKVLSIIDGIEMIENVAINGIDGVIYKKILEGLSWVE
ncbi:MAG: hypothetical protein PHF17_10040 [Arcobacteraceae bacterium]|nr:hypothetical protein [Arcobacteraceae bacterium]